MDETKLVLLVGNSKRKRDHRALNKHLMVLGFDPGIKYRRGMKKIVRRRYLIYMKKWHPDRNTSTNISAILQLHVREMNRAYQFIMGWDTPIKPKWDNEYIPPIVPWEWTRHQSLPQGWQLIRSELCL